MRDNNAHLSDQELLLYADGENSQYGMARVRKHLVACWTCRARLKELESVVADVVKLHRGRIDAQLPGADGIRSSFRAKLAAAAETRKASGIRLFPAAYRRQAACAAIALAIVFGVVWQMYVGRARSGYSVDAVMAGALPNRLLTPGYTRPMKLSEVCRMRQPNAPPDENAEVAQTVFREYGLTASVSGSYELDYLITPELGGADDVRNLWPEPYGSTEWNAHVKDELEDRLHTMVCDGQIDLATAQQEIATDWIAAYKRYFHTETPLPNAGDRTSSEDRNGRQIALVAGRMFFGLRRRYQISEHWPTFRSLPRITVGESAAIG